MPPLSLRTTFLKHSTRAWGGFFICALLGTVVAFGLLTLGSLGLVPAALAIWLVTAQPLLRRSAFGLVAGVGLPAMYVAYVQRRGPGTVCWHTATASGCGQYLNPWPWLLSGIVLVLAGCFVHVRRLRSGS